VIKRRRGSDDISVEQGVTVATKGEGTTGGIVGIVPEGGTVDGEQSALQIVRKSRWVGVDGRVDRRGAHGHAVAIATVEGQGLIGVK